MSIRLNDAGVILVPARSVNATTGKRRPDWSLEPTEVPTKLEVQEQPAGGGDEEGTGPDTWRAFLPADKDATLTTVCRLAWKGGEYVVDDIVRKRTKGRVRFLIATIKKAGPRVVTP